MVIWSSNNILVNVDIFVIDNNYRGLGYGSFFFNAISEYYKDEGYKILKLFCKPKSSESFWIRMGFEKMPDCGYTEHELTYFKVIAETASTSYIKDVDTIELWDVEPYLSDGIKPKWIWYIETKNNNLIHPIIQPCNCNWKLRWCSNGKILRENKVKYFTDENFELYTDRMLYIEQLF